MFFRAEVPSGREGGCRTELRAPRAEAHGLGAEEVPHGGAEALDGDVRGGEVRVRRPRLEEELLRRAGKRRLLAAPERRPLFCFTKFGHFAEFTTFANV